MLILSRLPQDDIKTGYVCRLKPTCKDETLIGSVLGSVISAGSDPVRQI
jgi:hypothetical protein